MCEAMRKTFEGHGYLADPHTAVALDAAAGAAIPVGMAAVPVAVLATASPCKFEESLSAALGAERWTTYTESRDFPAAARAVLAAPERPFWKLQSKGSLTA